MHQGNKRLNRLFAAAALAAVLMLAACGGDDSTDPTAEVKASADTSPSRVDEQLPPAGVRPAKKSEQPGNRDSKDHRKGKGRGTDSPDAAGSGAAAAGDPSRTGPSPGSASGSGSGSGQGANENEPQSSAKTKTKTKSKSPKKPKQTQPALPPQFAGKSIYEVAREMCGDPRILEFIPEDQQDNPEQLAEMARSFAPPGKEQEAYDGCLAGLHSIGL